MRTSNKGTHYLMTGAVFFSMLFLLVTLAPAQHEENAQVTRLLSDAREKAAQLSRDADEMEALTRSDVSWQTHAEKLEEIKGHVNDLARIEQQLTAARASASRWQQVAIDRMLPLLKELGANTTAAINHLNENKLRPTTGNYPEYLRANAETAHQLSDMISSFVQYGQTQAKLNTLEQKLEIATK